MGKNVTTVIHTGGTGMAGCLSPSIQKLSPPLEPKIRDLKKIRALKREKFIFKKIFSLIFVAKKLAFFLKYVALKHLFKPL